MREETMKNGRTLLKYILYAVALAVLAEFMMTLDYHSLLGAHGNSNQQADFVHERCGTGQL